MIKLNKSYNVEKKPLEYPLKNIYNKKADKNQIKKTHNTYLLDVVGS